MITGNSLAGIERYSCAALILLLAITPLRAELPPEAQTSMDKGVMAAKQQDYPLALRYFHEARKAAPEAPEVFFNLGLAESKIPGRELRAIAWFGAYLTANPTGANAAAVRKQMDVLTVKSQATIRSFLDVLERAALQVPPDPGFPTMGRDRGYIIGQATVHWAAVDDIPRAQKLMARNSPSFLMREQVLTALALALVRSGDLAGARRTAAQIENESDRKHSLDAIENAMTKASNPSNPAVDIRDWLELVTSTSRTFVPKPGSLDAGPFLDLAEHLKAIPAVTKDRYANFWALEETAQKLVHAQVSVEMLLKQLDATARPSPN